MGTVYRAHDLVDGSKVALKILSSEQIRDAERFAQEAAILATLCHPAIVRYIAHGVTADQHFLAMEWLDGESLDARADKEPLGVRQVLEVMRRTTQALAYAHERGIIHRDIKPDNLFLPGRADRGAEAAGLRRGPPAADQAQADPDRRLPGHARLRRARDGHGQQERRTGGPTSIRSAASPSAA